MDDTDSGSTGGPDAPREQPDAGPDQGAETTRHEERAEIGTERREAGRVRVRTEVETVPTQAVVSRGTEELDTSERVPAGEADSGEVETLEDGSLSVPLFEEILEITKRRVVRERVIVRKQTVVEEETVEVELRREHVTVEADDGVEVEHRDHGPSQPS
ncbi:DUF2382 domain-containing protein [Nocardioides sp. zg-DK7169]|uniref:DUF2382 domain-containing protein n=1 Tax=Nocardioides sp. zg-DK7169 TaxID=2736600 RepID=UPI0015519640|nr:DUF2382 domain-containing protein [Nocardioides sp. zg-DK7169]NPC97238.1 DUF2382 domain-containing protein [Nocardioides sp. zg-DK7169]